MEHQTSPATVILVHGLWMAGFELRWLGKQLEAGGFKVRYFRYCSWSGTLGSAAVELRRFAEQQGRGVVHLVGHSLGGIVIAKMLEEGELCNLGRIILLGSPQQGNVLAATLERNFAGRFILGSVACEGIVRNRPTSLAGRELLVVAGIFSLGFARLFGITGPNDGTVAVAETEVPGASQILVRASHMGMLFNKAVAASIRDYLKLI